VSDIPKDIETDIQWRVRHQAPGFPDREIVRILSEVQARSIATRLAELAPVVEARLITVGAWGDPALAEAALTAGEPDDEADG
jgi:hypothetical protein